MAEILIKGMEMPKYCRSCRFEESSIYGQKCCITRKFTRLFNNEDGMERHISCPLVEVPPHGDLIERSSVYKVLDDRIAFYKEAGDDYNACNIVCVEGDIVAIPTIIEASKERK